MNKKAEVLRWRVKRRSIFDIASDLGLHCLPRYLLMGHVFLSGSKSKGKSKKKEPAKKRRNAKMNQEEEAIEDSDEGDFDDRELDYITDSGER